MISREAFQKLPEALKRFSRSRLNKLFAGYEGDPGDLGPEMMARCSAVIFLAGYYSMRSPLCLQQLSHAVEAGVPIVCVKIAQGMMPPVIEECLHGATFVDMFASFMPNTVERGQASFENSIDELVDILRAKEEAYVAEQPRKVAAQIGEDADAFALEQVDGKFFVLVAHGGKHPEFATTMKHELEQHRLWSFVSHGDEHMDSKQRARFQHALETCMVFCPIVSERSLASPLLQEQIRAADAMGKPCFPVMLSTIGVPKNLRNPVSLLRRRAFVFHVHDGDESGAINFRVNFDHLSRVVRARVAEQAVHLSAQAAQDDPLLQAAKVLENANVGQGRSQSSERGRSSSVGSVGGSGKGNVIGTNSMVSSNQSPRGSLRGWGGRNSVSPKKQRRDSPEIMPVSGSPVRAARAARASRGSGVGAFGNASPVGPASGLMNDGIGGNQTGGKKRVSRYELLHQRVHSQQAALVEAQTALATFKKQNEQLTRQLDHSKGITGELLVCVEYYRTKYKKLYEICYPSAVAPGRRRSPGAVRLDNLRRELLRVQAMPRKIRTITSDLLHEGVPQTHKREEFKIALQREIRLVARNEGAIALQRIVRGAQTREREFHRRLLHACVFVQSRFRGYRVRKKLVWEEQDIWHGL